MSHRTPKALGVFVYNEVGTEYDWTSRALGDEFSTVSETMEEDVLQFVHSDITVTLDDSDGVVSALLMAIGATSKWRCEIWRNPSNWSFLWGGNIDATTIRQNFGNKTVSFTAYSFSKLLDLASAEDVKRTVTGVTGNAQIDSVILTVSDGTQLVIDDEIELSQSGVKEKRRIATKNGNSFTVTEAWKTSFSVATLTLLTPYYREQQPDYLARELFIKSGITTVHTRLDTLALSEPYPGRMNSSGLTRALVDCVTKRGSNIAVFENLASFYAPGPTTGFNAGSYTPDQPSDWTAYAGTEPASFKSIGTNDSGTRITGNQTVYYWYLSTDTTGTGTNLQLNLRLKDSTTPSARSILVANVGYNTDLYDGIPWFNTSLEYDQTESRVWVSYKGYKPDGQVDLSATGCKAYNGSTMVQDSTRPVVGGSKLRFSYIGPHMVEFGTDSINIRNAATPYATVAILEHRSNLVAWTLRRVSFDATSYWVCIQRREAAEFGKYEWFLILWSYTTGEVLSETKIAGGYAITRCYGSVWYDSIGVDDVYTGYVELEEVGGHYFYLTKSGANTIPYADFEGKSCSEAMRELAISSGCVIRVDRNKAGYFIGRNSLAAQFGSAPVTISDPLRKEKKRFWEWLRTSCEVTGKAHVTEDEFTELVGDTGNTQFRLSVEAAYVSTPGLARALAWNYVSFLNQTNGQMDVVVVEPSDGPVELFNRVILDGVTYRVFKTENDYATGEQSLTLVQE